MTVKLRAKMLWGAIYAVLSLAPFGIVPAQAASGVGDDAIPIPAHGSRIRIGGLWTNYDSRFATATDGSYKRRPLFAGYERANLGVADLPQLGATENNIRSLSGLGSAFSLSLGRLEASGNVVKSIVPFQFDFGVTRRLSVGILIPYVETTADNKFVLNRGGKGATVGENPARLSTGTARFTNGAVLAQVEAARAALAAEIVRCGDANATGGGCTAIRLNPASAQSLLSQAASIASQITALYGSATTAGAPLVPIQKSAAQTAVENTITGLRTSFMQYAVTAIDGTKMPAGATLVYGSAGLQALVKDTAYGLAYDTLTGGGRAGIGDVDVVATWLLLDGFGANQSKRLNATSRAWRSTISGGWRFGAATGSRVRSPFDLPTGDGTNALLVRSTTDLILGRRWWVSGTVRYEHALEDNLLARFPGLASNSLFAPSVIAKARRSLGSRTEIEIAPRYAINSFFGLSMAYGIGHQGVSKISTVAANTSAFSNLLESSATTVQSLQFGVTYSTLSGFIRQHSRWPIEVTYSHGLTVTASGGSVPSTTSDRVEMRIYTRFPRR
ncbi:MAG: hypothetical protein M3Y64_05825 [Gemmatimonadota bacterium]|nr:hypothetical protein [Gemmatimonadota bacterium]